MERDKVGGIPKSSAHSQPTCRNTVSYNTAAMCLFMAANTKIHRYWLVRCTFLIRCRLKDSKIQSRLHCKCFEDDFTISSVKSMNITDKKWT